GHGTVLDPACGDGAFLVPCLERLVQLRALDYEETPVADHASFMDELRLGVLREQIFGVDLNPDAIATLKDRVRRQFHAQPRNLDPVLDQNFRVGDALLGHDFETASSRDRVESSPPWSIDWPA